MVEGTGQLQIWGPLRNPEPKVTLWRPLQVLGKNLESFVLIYPHGGTYNISLRT